MYSEHEYRVRLHEHWWRRLIGLPVARERERQRGVSAIEFVLLTPLLFAMIFFTVQGALYFFARHIVLTAAQEGDNTARAEAAHPNLPWGADTAGVARQWIQNLGPHMVRNPAVSCALNTQQGVDVVTVTVSAQVPSWFGAITVTQSVTGPVEQFYSDTGQPPYIAAQSCSGPAS